MKFTYDLDILEGCAKNDDDFMCRELYNLHAKYYGYRQEVDSKDVFFDFDRFQKFKNSALHVYHHNSKPASMYQTELNKYSHLSEEELGALGIMNRPRRSGDTEDEQSLYYNVSKEIMVSRPKIDASSFYWENFSIELEKNTYLSKKTVSKVVNDIKQGFQTTFGEENDSYEYNLNWATGLNPDGISVVHPPQNQGVCGSCWAFTATGTVEANVARNVAFVTYGNNVLKRARNGDFDYNNSTQINEILNECRQEAKSAEQQAFDVASLSIQELIDCDTEYDLGCVGGNPLLAFAFIAEHGLVSSNDYPYVQHQEECQTEREENPLVKIKSFGILPSNEENFLANVLLEVGPVAVGFSVDRSFLAYSEGIFYSEACGQDLNHALLLVGYGQEYKIGPQGNITHKYWIARNSWSSDWGEDGYIKIARSRSTHIDTGDSMCGIATNPSIALGSYFVPGYFSFNDNDMNETTMFASLTDNHVWSIDEGNRSLSGENTRYMLMVFLFVLFIAVVCKLFSWFSLKRDRKREEEAEALVKNMVNYGSSDDSFLDPRKSFMASANIIL